MKKCRDLLEKAIRLEPDNAEALLMMGKTYCKLNEWKKGIDVLESSIRI